MSIKEHNYIYIIQYHSRYNVAIVAKNHLMKTQRTEMRLTIRIISHVIKWYNNNDHRHRVHYSRLIVILFHFSLYYPQLISL